MQLDVNRNDLTVGIIGAGAMGRGIAQVAAAGGMQVLITDSREGAAQEAREFVDKLFARAAEKGSMTKEVAAAASARIKVVSALAEFKPCHLVIEAIVENLEVKRALFAELEGIVAPDCILASNTSSLSITTIAAKLKTPQRFRSHVHRSIVADPIQIGLHIHTGHRNGSAGTRQSRSRSLRL